MKNMIKNTLRIGIIAAASAAAMVSCSDTWDEHYDKGALIQFNGTTMKAIEEKAPDFAKVLKAYGYDRELTSENVYTIWAPADGTFNLSDYVGEDGEPIAEEKEVLDRFIKNHVARYPVAENGTEQSVKMMNTKMMKMKGGDEALLPTIGSCNITEGNLSCSNGVLHIIDGVMDYKTSIFEQIKDWDDAAEDEPSLYAFLKAWDADSLDEAKSLYQGLDEMGNKQWIDRVTIRNNTALKSVDAPVYEEDSSFIAIVPTVQAYQKRLAIAKNLLKFNPASKDETTITFFDSLQNYYANMFAMADLFYNKTLNKKAWREDVQNYDSLRSTLYEPRNWPYNLYYSTVPRLGLHPDKQVNDILTKAKEGTYVECSNGDAYLVDKYPMSVTEQFFKKMNVRPSEATIDRTENVTIDKDGNVKATPRFTQGVGATYTRSGVIYDYQYSSPSYDDELIHYTDEEMGEPIGYTTRNYYFFGAPKQGNTSPKVTFKLPGTLSGTYDLYLVTCPIWAKTGFNDGQAPEDDPRGYRFYVNIYEKNDKGEYPNSSSRLTPPAGSGDVKLKLFMTKDEDEGKGAYWNRYLNKIDTLYLGSYTFKNAYYNRPEEGVLLQVAVMVTPKLEDTYSQEMLFSNIILKPKFKEDE